MNNRLKLFALGSMLAVSSTGVHAVLSGGEILNFADGVGSCEIGGTYPTCSYGASTVAVGSYFAMDISGNDIFDNNERIPIVNAGTGFTPGVAQGVGAIDNEWSFSGNAGWHHTSTVNGVPSVNPDGSIAMAGWTVFWNGGDIDMGTGAAATVTCGTDCTDGDTFTLDYEAVVPSGGFAGVKYQLHLEGLVVVLVSDGPPIANDDDYTVDRLSSGNSLNILLNDTDPESNIDVATVVIQTPVAFGTTTVNPDGTVTYDSTDTSLSPDSFTYTVKDTNANESNIATVSITLQNALPIAVDDAADINTATDGSVDIAVTVNDSDPDGTIDPASVVIMQDAVEGVTSLSNGVITYTPGTGFVGSEAITYTVNDNDGGTSNIATVLISVSDSGSAVLDPASFFIFNTGNLPAVGAEPQLGDGTWFSMQVLAPPALPTYTSLAGFNHLELGTIQLASSPSSTPVILLEQNIDQAWSFFGALGVSQTTIPVTIKSDDGSGNVTLDFTGWDISWNGIVSIPLPNGPDNGVATLTCFTDLVAGAPGDCSFGDEFLLTYSATVPDGDPSGFGNVNYILHMEGVISQTGVNITLPTAPDTASIQAFDAAGVESTVQPGDIATNAGNTSGTNLTASDVGIKDPLLNTDDGEQCVGGCVDFVLSNITTEYVDVVFRLNKVLPQGAIYRKFINGIWMDFDQATGDLVGSNADNGAGVCDDPVFNIGLRTGNQCVLLRIYDGGPNDADGVKNGTIVDPSGALVAGSPNVPESSTSGCSISNNPVSIVDRADWLLVAAFLIVLGLVNTKRRKSNS